jgi:hypothetical protein
MDVIGQCASDACYSIKIVKGDGDILWAMAPPVIIMRVKPMLGILKQFGGRNNFD